MQKFWPEIIPKYTQNTKVSIGALYWNFEIGEVEFWDGVNVDAHYNFSSRSGFSIMLSRKPMKWRCGEAQGFKVQKSHEDVEVIPEKKPLEPL